MRELLIGVPQIPYRRSGKDGFAQHLEPPYTRLKLYEINQNCKCLSYSALGEEIYMESVNCGANIAMMTFHGGIIRANFDKMGMVCIAGPPNVGKTKELKVAMHMASSDNYFFGMKVRHIV